MALHLKSHDFKDGQRIPVRFTFQGKSINPHLRWAGAPAGTQEFALICEDPDSPAFKPIVHWIAYAIPPEVHTIPRGLKRKSQLEQPVRIKQGLNSFFFSGWIGPNPGFWDRAHRYRFRLFALDRNLELSPHAGRGEFLKAIQGHVLEEASIVGLYEKTPAQKVKALAFWGAVAGSGVLLARQGLKRRSDRSL